MAKRQDLPRYRKLYPRFWRDEKVQTLSIQEKAVALYCLTGPQTNRIGLYCFSQALAAEDLNWGIQTFRPGFDVVCRGLNWHFDSACRVLYIPTWWRYNAPDNPNQLSAYLKDVRELPQSPLLAEFIGNTKYLPAWGVQTFGVTFRPGLALVAPQEQEQEQEQEVTPCSPPLKSKRAKFDPSTVELPAELDTPEFRGAWADWLAYRREIAKPLKSERSVRQQLDTLRRYGPEKAAECIRTSIGNQWQGLFPDKEKRRDSRHDDPRYIH